MPKRLLESDVIVVVGGTSGMGLAGVKACCAAGAKVVASGKETSEIEEANSELGDQAYFMIADATDSTATERVFQFARKKFGTLDGLYHVAGGSGRDFGDGRIVDISNSAWRKTIELNLDSVFYSNRAAIRMFLEEGKGGAIVNMSSVLAFSPSPGHFSTQAYATSKAGVIGLSQSLASCYAPQGIRVNVIAPGLVETPMSRRARENSDILRYIQKKQPLVSGMGQPDDLNEALVFLLSKSARLFSGQVLAADGGWSISEG